MKDGGMIGVVGDVVMVLGCVAGFCGVIVGVVVVCVFVMEEG